MDESDLDPDPLAALGAWLDEARRAVVDADVMTLATATPDGHPSARVVLVRGVGPAGVDFFTNRLSRKGRELAANPRAALVLHWWKLGRQVRVEGDVEALGDEDSEAYWRTRPRASQLAAWASPQSRTLPDRKKLDARVRGESARFAGSEIPLPPFWGGYRVVPRALEFWTHRDDRLHDRIRYDRVGSRWRRERLFP